MRLLPARAHTAAGLNIRRGPKFFIRSINRTRTIKSSIDAETLHTQKTPSADDPPERQNTSRSASDREAQAAVPLHVPETIQRRNADFATKLQNQLILAPLTRGGNLPFRLLCKSFGADVTMSEMVFARMLLKGDPVEKARLYKAEQEQCFGVQMATKVISEGVAVAKLAEAAGATWIDLNCGCPIYEALRRGVGAELLKKPTKLARLVNGIVLESPLPVTVKIRTGESESKINAARVVELLQQAGAAAVTIHGRTKEQRYRKAADWQLIGEIAAANDVPIIGNGDILTEYEAQHRKEVANCHAMMVGRGALVKPWIFQEVKEGRELLLTAQERVGVYRQLVANMKAHFGNDALGRRKAWYFLPWHFSFLHRYRPLPASIFQEAARQYPLIGGRLDIVVPELGEQLEDLGLLERLLRCPSEAAHEAISAVLWDSTSDAAAVAGLEQIAAADLDVWEAEVKAGGGGEEQQAQG